MLNSDQRDPSSYRISMATAQLGEEIAARKMNKKKTLRFQKGAYHSSNYIKRIPHDDIPQNLSQMN